MRDYAGGLLFPAIPTTDEPPDAGGPRPSRAVMATETATVGRRRWARLWIFSSRGRCQQLHSRIGPWCPDLTQPTAYGDRERWLIG